MIELEARFTSKFVINPETGCWLWTAGCNGGYGLYWSAGKHFYAHRYAYEKLVGPIPEGLELDHLCRVHSCCNPTHLEAVTHAENTHRGTAGRVSRDRQLAKTHCPYGHPYSGDNLYIAPDGGRRCKECQRRYKKKYKTSKA